MDECSCKSNSNNIIRVRTMDLRNLYTLLNVPLPITKIFDWLQIYLLITLNIRLTDDTVIN